MAEGRVNYNTDGEGVDGIYRLFEGNISAAMDKFRIMMRYVSL